MNNENLIEYLKSCWDPLEASIEWESGDSKILSYLYFAPVEERMSIHVAEKALNCGSRLPIHLNLTQKNQNDILALKPLFDDALAKKKIISIATYSFPKTLENASDSAKVNFKKELEGVEKSRGILNALLTLREWACFPKEIQGTKNRQRLAKSYFGVVLNKLSCIGDDNEEIRLFLSWCDKRTSKIFPWGKFKKKDLRDPPTSALPIYKDEAANYVRHFLQLACNPKNSLRQDFAEMVIFLSLCLAGARQYSNCFNPTEILEVTNSSIGEVETILQKKLSKPARDLIEKSKSKTHKNNLKLRLAEDFLSDKEIWPLLPSSSTPEQEYQNLSPLCKMIKIKDKSVLVGQRLAHAVELMETFSLTDKDVENRLQEAYKVVGLSQSSGGISRRCFLYAPHYWEGVDLRKNLTEKNQND